MSMRVLFLQKGDQISSVMDVGYCTYDEEDQILEIYSVGICDEWIEAKMAIDTAREIIKKLYVDGTVDLSASGYEFEYNMDDEPEEDDEESDDHEAAKPDSTDYYDLFNCSSHQF